MAGYSPRSLIEKLGIKPGFHITIVNPPAGYNQILGVLPPMVIRSDNLQKHYNFIQIFVMHREELITQFLQLKSAVYPDGMLWISWPKGSSTISTDLNENIIREIGLEQGMVDVKVCAIDDDWSGLKFVYRLKDR